jgi:hypothetical protein
MSQANPLDRGLITLRVSDAARLFATDPLVEDAAKGLASPVADQLLARAKDVSAKLGIALRVEVPGAPAELEAKLRAAFALAAAEERMRLSELFRWGRRALVLGLAVMVSCLTIAIHGQEVLPGLALPTVVKEAAKIIGWVAMWKPMEIFLYDWMPIQRRRRVFERLAAARIEVIRTGA